MRILYAISDRPGAWLQASIVLKEISPHYEVKFAAFKSISEHISNIDFNLSILHNSKDKISKKYDITISVGSSKAFEQYLDFIKEFKPDLVISDHEEFTLAAAYILKIKNWNVSPLNLLYYWFPVSFRSYYDWLLYYYKRQTLRYNRKYFLGNLNLTYSPLCYMKIPMDWRYKKINWVKPFEPNVTYTDQNISLLLTEKRQSLEQYFDQVPNITNQFNKDPFATVVSRKNNFCTGESGYLYSFLLNEENLKNDQFKINICPNFKDIDTVLNAVVIKNNRIGQDLGQIENMKEHSIIRVDSVINNEFDLPINFKLSHKPYYRKIKFSLLERIKYHESMYGHRKRIS
jgi:hypothetical protein